MTAAPSPSGAKRLILIVDDVAENLQVLAGHLTEAGYEVMAANNGPRAVALARNRRPDLILLDIMMPVMDGFAVCRELKADRDTLDVPVIFITARTETNDVIEGFKLGAVDYITKPFKSPELLARVRTHLELKAARDTIVANNRELERLSARLQKHNADKNRFIGIVSHDIRGAFGNVISVSGMLTDGHPIEPEEAAALLTDIGIEAEHMTALAENLLNIDAIERQEIRPKQERVPTEDVLKFVLKSHRMASRAKRLTFVTACDRSDIKGDQTLCRQVLTNFVSNAVKYSSPGSTIWLTLQREPGDTWVRISVRDEGPGLTADDQRQLFTAYTRLSSKATAAEHSVGLGLAIVKTMVVAMGGSVQCDSHPGQGATFSALLPLWS